MSCRFSAGTLEATGGALSVTNSVYNTGSIIANGRNVTIGGNVGGGIVRANAPRGGFHVLLGCFRRYEPLPVASLASYLTEKTMTAARNRGQAEAQPASVHLF